MSTYLEIIKQMSQLLTSSLSQVSELCKKARDKKLEQEYKRKKENSLGLNKPPSKVIRVEPAHLKDDKMVKVQENGKSQKNSDFPERKQSKMMIKVEKQSKESSFQQSPKKPTGGYALFLKQRKAKVSKLFPQLTQTQISQVCVKEWTKLPPEKKQIYLDRAKTENDIENVEVHKNGEQKRTIENEKSQGKASEDLGIQDLSDFE